MNNLTHTKLYSLDINDIEHQVAHVYEHILLRQLDRALKTNGILAYLQAYWQGETYSGYILIQFETTNSSAAKIFDDFSLVKKNVFRPMIYLWSCSDVKSNRGYF